MPSRSQAASTRLSSEDYKTELNAPQTALVANWHFDEGIGTLAADIFDEGIGALAADSSGNHHDATLNGGVTFSTDFHVK